MSENYILIGQTAVPESDLLTWAKWLESADRIVAQTPIPGGMVSTVFLGLDHDFSGKGPPLLFETMIFHDGESDGCWRTSTWLEAESMHHEVLAKCGVELP